MGQGLLAERRGIAEIPLCGVHFNIIISRPFPRVFARGHSSPQRTQSRNGLKASWRGIDGKINMFTFLSCPLHCAGCIRPPFGRAFKPIILLLRSMKLRVLCVSREQSERVVNISLGQGDCTLWPAIALSPSKGRRRLSAL